MTMIWADFEPTKQIKKMSNYKHLIRWEKHYSDGSVEYTDQESTKNFEDNLSSVEGLIASRSYIQMKPVEWEKSKAENLPISNVSDSIPPLFRYYDENGTGNNVLVESKEWCMVLSDDKNTPHVEPREFIVALVEGGNDR